MLNSCDETNQGLTVAAEEDWAAAIAAKAARMKVARILMFGVDLLINSLVVNRVVEMIRRWQASVIVGRNRKRVYGFLYITPGKKRVKQRVTGRRGVFK